MGFFSQIRKITGASALKSSSRNNSSSSKDSLGQASIWPGSETLEVVGESHYQENLWRLVGGSKAREVRAEIVAVIAPEPKNRFDPNAVKVTINGLQVGHLSRDQAVAYGPGLKALMERSAGGRVALSGVIVGGGNGRHLGVFLEHDPSDFGISSGRKVDEPASFRTGLSEAMFTDREDDSYDLSWYQGLSSDNTKAITQLRKLLVNDPDPIDRHFMFCELESRLYKSRDAFDSALDEFDNVCVLHDSELETTIRKALMDKFGKLPVLDLYKQSAIRHQKAKNFEKSAWWARRGIAIYGENAGVEGVVEDLIKRATFAESKINGSKKENSIRTQAVDTGSEGDDNREVLVCQTCSSRFERPVSKGRKPLQCSSCKGN
jgi:hypothetical protein